jgi:outer membrane protein assembly complex protein YaeT
MRLRQVIAAMLAVPSMVCALPAAPRQDLPDGREAVKSRIQTAEGTIIEDISFVGLRRIARQAVAEHISTRVGDTIDVARLARDVRSLGQLEWFESIRVEEMNDDDKRVMSDFEENTKRVRLQFYLEERPFLASVTYDGSRLISKQQIEKFLADQNIVMKFGEPENPLTVHRSIAAIRLALAELGHPEAQVKLSRKADTNGSVHLRFEIADGLHLRVTRVTFEGHTGLSTKTLRLQMERLRPDTMFAGLRGKDTYTRGRFAEDRERILAYYRNHGYPEARVGMARVWKVEGTSRQWLPWPRTKPEMRLLVSVPVESGPYYRLELVQVSQELRDAAASPRDKVPAIPQEIRRGKPYSAQAIETLRRAWESRVQLNPKHATPTEGASLGGPEAIGVEAVRTFDPASHIARIYLQRSLAPSYLVRRLEFRGIHRFPDRYFRRRIPLTEGAPFNDNALETGLARLARTSYFKPIKNEDVHVKANDVTRTVDVTINIEELGQQRASLVGGRGQFGSTLGIVYTIFNLLHGEELLSSQVEGGPESLQLAIGFAKEGFLGTRGSLALSLFNTLLRPRLTGSAKGPFFMQQSQGVNATWTYALTRSDSLNVSYDLAHTSTQYSSILPPGFTGLQTSDIPADTLSRGIGLGWTHDTGAQRIVMTESILGGWLGGTENAVRSKAEYGRIWHDPWIDARNAWAMHGGFKAVGSYSGDLPFYARLFAGDDFVRGLRAGELGSQATVSSASSSGVTKYSASPAGANLVGAANAEYRMPIGTGTELSGFFDIGSGMLLPQWLGSTRPALIDTTNRVLHASAGIQVQWTVPGIGVPLRAYYAVNVLRLDRGLPMPDGSSFHAHDRFSAFGWALAPMF